MLSFTKMKQKKRFASRSSQDPSFYSFRAIYEMIVDKAKKEKSIHTHIFDVTFLKPNWQLQS